VAPTSGGGVNELTIEARVDHVGYSSWTIAFTAQIAREAGTDLQERLHAEEEIVAEGQMTMVAIDTKTERSRPLPDDLRKALTGI